MKTTWLIFKKDTLRFWPLLLVWFCLLTLATINMAAGFPNLDDVAIELLTTARWIVFILLAISLVQADRLVGDREFWMTRPVPPIALVGAKIVGLTIWLIIPASLADVSATLWLGATTHQLLVAGLGTALWATTLALGAAALAAITTTIVQWTIAAISLCLTMAAVSLCMTIAAAVPSPILNQPISRAIYQSFYTPNGQAGWAGTSIAACVLALALLVYQSVARRRGHTVALAFFSCVVVWDTAAIWPEQNPPAAPVVHFTPVPAPQLKMQPPTPLEGKWLGQRTSFFVTPLKISGAAGNQVFSVRDVESRLTTSSGTKEWNNRMDDSYFWKSYLFSHPWNEPASSSDLLRRLPDVYRALGWSDHGDGEISTINAELWAQRGTFFSPESSGKLESKLSLGEYSINLNVELPLQEGAAVRTPGSYLRITQIEHASGAYSSRGGYLPATFLIVTLESHAMHRHLPFLVFLLNRSRHELIAGTNLNFGDESCAESPFSTIWAASEQIGFMSLELGKVDPTAEWLAGASLAIVSLTPGDRVEKTIVIDPFTLPSPKAQ